MRVLSLLLLLSLFTLSLISCSKPVDVQKDILYENMAKLAFPLKQ